MHGERRLGAGAGGTFPGGLRVGGFDRMIFRPAATPTAKVAVVLSSGFPGAVYAVFGFGADGTAAAGSAAACRPMQRHEDRGCLSAASPPPVSVDATVVFASDWSFSVLCCDATDERALSDADAVACELARRGHMAVVLGAGPLAAPPTASIEAEEGRDRPARLLLPVPDRRGGLAPVLAASAAALLSSVACRGIVGVDASDVWSAIGGPGPGPGVAVLATARRGQEADGFGRSAVSAVREVGVKPSSVRRLLISAVLPPGWRLRELDETASAVSGEFAGAETIITPRSTRAFGIKPRSGE
jgi:hypothetical protein